MLRSKSAAWVVIIGLALLISPRTWSRELPEVGPPPSGPLPPAAKPLVLMENAINQKDYGDYGLIADLMSMASDARYSKAAAATEQAVHAAYPDLSLNEELQAAFACGSAASLCTEFAKFEPGKDAVLQEGVRQLRKDTTFEEGLRQLLASKGWSEARVLTVWWHSEGGYMAARGSVKEVAVSEGDKLLWSQPILVGYYVMPPRFAARAKNPQVHSAEWAAGAKLPEQQALRAAARGLEPLLRVALSWGVNNDPKVFKPELWTQLGKMRAKGIGCDGLRLCVAGYVGVVDDRVWTWLIQHESVDFKKYGRFVFELQSRDWMNP